MLKIFANSDEKRIKGFKNSVIEFEQFSNVNKLTIFPPLSSYVKNLCVHSIFLITPLS